MNVFFSFLCLSRNILGSWSEYFGAPDIKYTEAHQAFLSQLTADFNDFYLFACSFSGLGSSSKGGAIFAETPVRMLIESTNFKNCQSSSGEGAVHYSNSNGQFVFQKICAFNCFVTKGQSHFCGIKTKYDKSYKNLIDTSSVISSDGTKSCSTVITQDGGGVFFKNNNISGSCAFSNIYELKCDSLHSGTGLLFSVNYCNIAKNKLHEKDLISIFIYDNSCNFDTCNIIGNQVESDVNTGLIVSSSNCLIKGTCFKSNNWVNVFYKHYDSPNKKSITLKNCSFDKEVTYKEVTVSKTECDINKFENVIPAYHTGDCLADQPMPLRTVTIYDDTTNGAQVYVKFMGGSSKKVKTKWSSSKSYEFNIEILITTNICQFETSIMSFNTKDKSGDIHITNSLIPSKCVGERYTLTVKKGGDYNCQLFADKEMTNEITLTKPYTHDSYGAPDSITIYSKSNECPNGAKVGTYSTTKEGAIVTIEYKDISNSCKPEYSISIKKNEDVTQEVTAFDGESTYQITTELKKIAKIGQTFNVTVSYYNKRCKETINICTYQVSTKNKEVTIKNSDLPSRCIRTEKLINKYKMLGSYRIFLTI